MALGVIRIRGNLCQYTGGGKGKKGKFTTCRGKRLTGKSAGKKRGRSAASKTGCRKQVVNQFGNRRCRTVCRNSKGRITSSKPASGCKRI
jgi:hypothetical protein